METFWNFITEQFAFSQAGMSQSAWFWAVVNPLLAWKFTKDYYKKKYAKGQ